MPAYSVHSCALVVNCRSYENINKYFYCKNEVLQFFTVTQKNVSIDFFSLRFLRKFFFCNTHKLNVYKTENFISRICDTGFFLKY